MVEKTELIVGKKVSARRKALNMSQSDLALKARTSLTTINRLEKGHQFPGFDTIAEIARALKTSQAELILDIQDKLKTLTYDQLEALDDSIEHLKNPVDLEDTKDEEIDAANEK